jgi:hypothetical protein
MLGDPSKADRVSPVAVNLCPIHVQGGSHFSPRVVASHERLAKAMALADSGDKSVDSPNPGNDKTDFRRIRGQHQFFVSESIKDVHTCVLQPRVGGQLSC